MTADRREKILCFLRQFEQLERKATDAAGWIALKFSISRDEAEREIRKATKGGTAR